MDPNYSVLLTPDDNTDNNSDSCSNIGSDDKQALDWIIIVVICVCVVVIVAAFGIGLKYLYPKLQQKWCVQRVSEQEMDNLVRCRCSYCVMAILFCSCCVVVVVVVAAIVVVVVYMSCSCHSSCCGVCR